MSIAMPRVVQHPTPNYTPTEIKHDLFVLHDQEGFTLPSVAWLCDPRANASAQLCLSEDGQTVYQLVPISMKAWHAKAFNSLGIGLEIPGFAAKGFSDDLLRVSALIAAWYCRAYSIPLVWAQGGQGRGLCCHHDLGLAGGGHTDVGPVGGETWQRFMGFVRAAYDELVAGPFPTFALDGVPIVGQVSSIPNIAPSPSHGGAPRNDGDVHAHATPSTFTAHSIAAAQFDLNAIMGTNLDVDGWYGDKTRSAVIRFQAAHNCNIDGKLGPETWAALNAAMAA